MFTGIIAAVGRVRARRPQGGDIRLSIGTGRLDLSDVKLGDSIAVSGVCLTVTELETDGFGVDVSLETLAKTTLGELAVGARVNLEKALRLADRLGGHLVAGHVDGVGEVVDLNPAARSVVYRIQAPRELRRYIAPKGSICVDGVSLTVNAVQGAYFDLNLIPHTLTETTASEWRQGRRVNLEADLIARYLERLTQGEAADLDADFLAEHGFA